MNAELSFPQVLDSVGRSDLRGGYRRGSYEAGNDKFEEREKVLGHILQHSSRGKQLNLLSFPGESWAFEQLVMAHRPNALLLGLERSATSFLKAKGNIPSLLARIERQQRFDDFRHCRDGVVNYGRAQIVSAMRLARRKNSNRGARSHNLLLIDASTFMTITATDYGASMEQKYRFNRKFQQNNAAWLDFTGTLCSSTEEALANLHFALDPRAATIPVVVTVQNCRDRFRGVENRVSRVAELIRDFEVTDSWTYQGKGGVSMLTVCGVVRQATA